MPKKHLHVDTGDACSSRYDGDGNDDGRTPDRSQRRRQRRQGQSEDDDDGMQPPSPANTADTEDSFEDYDEGYEYDDEHQTGSFRDDECGSNDHRQNDRRNRSSNRNHRHDEYDSNEPRRKDPNVVVIEHQHTDGKSSKKGGGGAAAVRNLSRPMKMVIGLILLLSTGGFAYFFREWFRIPGLETQIQRLEAEIGRLSGEVDRLSSELDRYEGLNSQLNSTILELDAQNDRLNASNAQFRQLNQQLNASVVELQVQNDKLEEQVDVFEYLNDNLNITTITLATEVRRLERAVDRLEEENDGLRFLVKSLSNETDTLSNLNDELRGSLEQFEGQVGNLTAQVDRLDELNEELSTIVSFLNETAGEFERSFDGMSKFLTTQITAYRDILVDDTKKYYDSQVDHWDCLYYNVFELDPFGQDPTAPIGSERFEDVMIFVDTNVLSKLCLSRPDFETYLQKEVLKTEAFPPVGASTDDIVSAINLYTLFVMNYYFPFVGSIGDGLSSDEWAEARYDCSNLSDDQLFLYYT